MKIALVCPKLREKGGAEMMALLLARKLSEHGHQVTLFTRSFNQQLWGEVGSQTFDVRLIRLQLVPKQLRTLWVALFVGRRLKEFDIVNPHNYPSYVWSACASLLHRFFPPIVWFCHEPPRSLYYSITETHRPDLFRDDVRRRKLFHGLYAFFRPWRKSWEKRREQWAVRHCQAILTNSRYTASLVKKIYGVHAEPCYVGIASERVRSAGGVCVKERYACVVSRLTFHKNVDTVLKAVALMIKEKKTSDFHLKVIGKGPEEMKLKELAQSLHIGPYVHFAGFVSDEAMQQAYAGAEFVINVPLNEPFGLVTIEAMAQGTAVIGTNDAGPGEVIEHGETGLLVDPLNEAGLAEAMFTLWSDHDLCTRLGCRGRQAVERHYTDEAFVRRFLSFIEGVKKEKD